MKDYEFVFCDPDDVKAAIEAGIIGDHTVRTWRMIDTPEKSINEVRFGMFTKEKCQELAAWCKSKNIPCYFEKVNKTLENAFAPLNAEVTG